MLSELKALVEITPKTVIGQVLKSKKHKDLLFWLNNETTELGVTTIAEKVYFVINGKPNPICEHGCKRTLNRTGYGFCGNTDVCKCFREMHSKLRAGKDVSNIIEKRTTTWLAKYGVDNPSRSTDIKCKRKNTMQQRTYENMYSRLANNKETIGFEQVINRVKDVVTPQFTREEYSGCFRKNSYKWKCEKCGNIFEDHVDYGRTPRCQQCFPHDVSAGELELREWIKSNNITIVENDRSTLSNLELDILIPTMKIAIEFNGVYWHSSKFKPANYHVEKYLLCKEKGIHLIQIFEDEWNTKKDIVKARLLSKFKISEKNYARKCVVKHVSPAEYRKFTVEHHLQGYAASSILYGLFHQDHLVAVMSFSKSRYSNEGYELVRYCSIGTVVGGAGKLFAAFVKKCRPSTVVSYANRCWSDGSLYRCLGFVDVTKNQYNVGFWYVKDFKRNHRSTFNKQRLVKLGFDQSMTAEKIMDNAGYLKIFDCGNYKFVWTPKQLTTQFY